MHMGSNPPLIDYDSGTLNVMAPLTGENCVIFLTSSEAEDEL